MIMAHQCTRPIVPMAIYRLGFHEIDPVFGPISFALARIEFELHPGGNWARGLVTGKASVSEQFPGVQVRSWRGQRPRPTEENMKKRRENQENGGGVRLARTGRNG